MPTVTGNVTDLGLGHLVGKSLQLVFTLNAPNSGGANLYPTEPVRVTPGADGSFSVNLAATTEMNGNAYILLSAHWLNSVGETPVRADWDGWELQVPTGGGSVSGLWGKPPANTRMVYVSLTPPENPKPFTLWLQANPDNDLDPLNTWDLAEWRNV